MSRVWLWASGGAVVLAAALLLFVRIEQAGHAVDSPASGSASVASLTSPVSIVRDRYGVPHVEAATPREAYLALGFAHAQQRFWQMEMLRRTARGRLSELFGERTLGADRLARTLGLAVAADAERSRLSSASEAVLVAYSAGVNAWLAELGAGRVPEPLELAWLDLEPEPWTPEDTLAIVRLRAWNLGRSLGASLLLDRLVRDVGGVTSSDLFPARPRDGAHDPLATLLELGRRADELAAVVGMRGPVGSLGFAVGAGRSASRAPLLANDPHMEFGLPAHFFLVHLATPELELSGATWPGVPVFWTGSNLDAAWGQVITHASVSDLFDETLHPNDPLRYDRGGRWRRAERRVELIGVRGGATEELEVVSTYSGPLLRSLQPEDPRARTLALRWTGQTPWSGIDELLRLQQARDWESFRAALKRYPAPAATFLYADAAGTIGRQLAGRLPVRPIETALLPVTGGSRYYEWRGYVPFDDLPSVHGRALPWLVASTHPDDEGFAAAVSWLWSSPGGADRLRDRLASGPPLSLEDVVELQRERHSERGRASVRRLLRGASPRTQMARRIHRELLDWDGATHTASTGAAVYHAFRERLTLRLLEERVGAEYAERIAAAAEPLPGVVLGRFLERVDSTGTSGRVEEALEETGSYLRARVSSNPAKWVWGQVHQLRLLHDFERLGGGLTWWIGRGLGRGPFPAPGDPDSVWAMHHDLLPSSGAVGPVLRYAVDLADARHAPFGLAGGQSGHPGARHYDDALADWLRGRPRTLWMHPSDVAYDREGIWKLHPRAD